VISALVLQPAKLADTHARKSCGYLRLISKVNMYNVYLRSISLHCYSSPTNPRAVYFSPSLLLRVRVCFTILLKNCQYSTLKTRTHPYRSFAYVLTIPKLRWCSLIERRQLTILFVLCFKERSPILDCFFFVGEPLCHFENC